MPLDDAAIERYSRQLVLPEVGPLGQARLAAARVAVTGGGPAAERIVAYLAAAGVGTLAVPPELDAQIDPAQPGLRIERPSDVSVSPGVTAVVDVISDARTTAANPTPMVAPTRRFWIGGGRAAEVPPCPDCVAAMLPASSPTGGALVAVRDALLGTIIATEVVKVIVGIGTSLRGTVVTYDPGTAVCERTPLASRPSCATCAVFATP